MLHLRPLGLMTKVDINAMAWSCSLFVRWRAAMEFVEPYGETYTIKNAKEKVVAIRLLPQAQRMRDLSTDLFKIEREFGMISSARASFGKALEDGTPKEKPQGKGRFSIWGREALSTSR